MKFFVWIKRLGQAKIRACYGAFIEMLVRSSWTRSPVPLKLIVNLPRQTAVESRPIQPVSGRIKSESALRFFIPSSLVWLCPCGKRPATSNSSDCEVCFWTPGWSSLLTWRNKNAKTEVSHNAAINRVIALRSFIYSEWGCKTNNKRQFAKRCVWRFSGVRAFRIACPGFSLQRVGP